MKVLNYVWTKYVFAFFVALFMCLVDLIVDGTAAGSARYWSYFIIAFVVLSTWDLIKFIISKAKN